MTLSVWEAWAASEMHPGGRQTTRLLLEAAGLQAGARVADIGCGAGAGVAFLLGKGFAAVGVDISPLLCERARARGLAALCADARRLPFGAGEMDGLLFECTLSALPDIPAVLQECGRTLKAGGALLVSDIRYEAAQEARRAWAERLADAGFALIHWEDRPGLLEEFRSRLLWEVEDAALLKGLCETGCGAGEGYFTMAARLEQKAGGEAR